MTNYTNTLLIPINDNLQNDSNLEPQFIRKRAGNMGLAYLDSSKASGTANNFIVSGFVFNRSVKRFALSAIRQAYTVPNVNPYNNNVQIILEDTVNVLFRSISFNMPEGYYKTTTEFMTEFINQMTTSRAFIPGWGVWTITADPHNSDVYIIDAGLNYTFYFVNSCNMVKNGRFLCNLPTDQNGTRIKRMGEIQLTYTRWVDITSFALNEHTKNINSTNGSPKGDLVLRLFETPQSLNNDGQFMTFSKDRFIERNKLSWTNYEKEHHMTNIDIQLYDEFGNLLYIPTYADRPTTFYTCIELTTEL